MLVLDAYCLVLLHAPHIDATPHHTCLFCNWRSLSILCENGDWQRINMTQSINIDVDILPSTQSLERGARATHTQTHTQGSRSRSLTMCHKNWLFIKFYGCLLFDRWRIWLKCCIDARRLRAETKMCAIFFAIDRFPINIMLSFKRIMSSVWHCSHSLLSLLRLMVGV